MRTDVKRHLWFPQITQRCNFLNELSYQNKTEISENNCKRHSITWTLKSTFRDCLHGGGGPQVGNPPVHIIADFHLITLTLCFWPAFFAAPPACCMVRIVFILEDKKLQSSEVNLPEQGKNLWRFFSLVWESLGSELAVKFQKLCNCAAKTKTFSSYDSTFGPLLQEVEWDSLSMSRIKLLAIDIFKGYKNMAPEYICQKVLKCPAMNILSKVLVLHSVYTYTYFFTIIINLKLW